jgi:hypothetical protein
MSNKICYVMREGTTAVRDYATLAYSEQQRAGKLSILDLVLMPHGSFTNNCKKFSDKSRFYVLLQNAKYFYFVLCLITNKCECSTFVRIPVVPTI